MKLWVIGALGTVGKALLQLCRAKEIEAIGTSREQADITRLSDLRKWGMNICPTHIVNCAAFTNVDLAETQRGTAFLINAEGAGNVAIVAQEIGSRLVHLSTDYVFDGKKDHPYLEDDLCAPINVYGWTKHCGEDQVLSHFPQACVLRTSWVFGGTGHNFLSKLFYCLKEKREVSAVFDQCGRPTYHLDLAEAIFQVLDYEGILHFANRGEGSRYEIATRLRQLLLEMGLRIACEKVLPVQASSFPTIAPRPHYSVLSTSLYESLTSQRPRGWEEAFKELVVNEKMS